jgi:serine/threonine protein kinase
VMELLDGFSLEKHLESVHPRSSDEVVRIAIEICRGLACAHAHGVVHRDLKPANVFLHHKHSGENGVKLLDFGFSKLTSPDDPNLFTTGLGVALGTPHYMSPEQARGGADVDWRSDLWSVGVILYEAVSGTLPFDAPNYNAILDAISRMPPRRMRSELDVAPALASLIRRCLAKSPADRYQSAQELILALEQVLAELPAITTGIAARPRLRSLPEIGALDDEPARVAAIDDHVG